MFARIAKSVAAASKVASKQPVVSILARNVSFGKAALQKPAPAFEANAVFPDMSIKKVNLDQYKGKYFVFFWYPKDFTFVCPTEIISFSERAADFEKINCNVLAASIDSEAVHQAWMQTDRKKGGLGAMNIPILSDVSRKVSTDYGALLEPGFTCRATYIIDDKGVLRHASFNDPPAGRSVDETLRLVQAYQFFDKNGEVCPANWKPGSATIKPSLAGSKEYFQKAN